MKIEVPLPLLPISQTYAQIDPGSLSMNPFERPGRCCPKCQHNGYMFRAEDD